MITIVMDVRFREQKGLVSNFFSIDFFESIANDYIYIYISYRIVLECNAVCKRDVIKVEGGRRGGKRIN